MRGCWALMLRTGWVVVRRTTRVSSLARSMVIVSTATWTVTMLRAAAGPAPRRARPWRGPPGARWATRTHGHADQRQLTRHAVEVTAHSHLLAPIVWLAATVSIAGVARDRLRLPLKPVTVARLRWHDAITSPAVCPVTWVFPLNKVSAVVVAA